MKVAGSLIVVTGGSSGLGAATTRHLVSRGARVLNLDRQKPTYSDISEEWVFWPGECDVGSEESVKAALEKGFAKLGGDKWPVRGCVNCAGFGTPAATLRSNGEPMPLATFEKDVRVNIIGSFNVSRLVASHMAKHSPPLEENERGVIVLTASIAALDSQPRMIGYNVGKAGTAAMTLPLARDLASFGIRVMTIAPGTFGTPLYNSQPEKVKEKMVLDIVWPKRVGVPDEYAALVGHIFENKYLNAETIRLDGGFRIRPSL